MAAVRPSFHPVISIAIGPSKFGASRVNRCNTGALACNLSTEIRNSNVDTTDPRQAAGSYSVRLNTYSRQVFRSLRSGVVKVQQLGSSTCNNCELQGLEKLGNLSHQEVRRSPLRAAAITSMEVGTKAEDVEKQGEQRPPMFNQSSYSAPSWASYLHPVPSSIFSLGLFPTPIHRWNLPGLPSGTELWIKRDDLTGMQLSGNKVRKLEFLMADAKAQGADCVITLGGIQSNHCRATAVAARYLGFDAYLILRTSRTVVTEDPGLEGNLLVERLVGANIDLITKEEYVKYGSKSLGEMLVKRLKAEGRRPYLIPVGGSNSLGTWGYIEGVREIEHQLREGRTDGATHFDDIVMACGSGGTTAGLALGSHLSTLKSKVHAYAVCDNEEYFYDYIQGLLDGFNADVSSRDVLEVKMAKGLGYAMSTAEELKVVKDVAEKTGVILDPVYSGKAINGMLKDMSDNPSVWQGRKVLFVHTGGLLGMYDKVDQLQTMVGRSQRMSFLDVSDNTGESYPKTPV